MKLLIISDIHGDYENLYKITQNECFDQLIILGDLFSYGYSINDDEENPIIHLLQKYKNKLILIKGNCDFFINYDAYSLQSFDIITLPFNKRLVTFTHGNRYSKGFLPEYHGDIFISGHTHIPTITKDRGIIYANPGSISKPRGGSKKSYMVFEENKIIIKDINGNIQKAIVI